VIVIELLLIAQALLSARVLTVDANAIRCMQHLTNLAQSRRNRLRPRFKNSRSRITTPPQFAIEFVSFAVGIRWMTVRMVMRLDDFRFDDAESAAVSTVSAIAHKDRVARPESENALLFWPTTHLWPLRGS